MFRQQVQVQIQILVQVSNLILDEVEVSFSVEKCMDPLLPNPTSTIYTLD